MVALSSLARVFGECSTIHYPPELFFFFFKLELPHIISTLYARIRPQWLIELRQLWRNVPWQVAFELVSWGVPTLCLNSGIVSPLRLRWVKDACVFKCNLSPALLKEWPGSFTCHCGNTGVERTPNKSQRTKLTLEKKILRRSGLEFELAIFRPRVRRYYQQAIPAPIHIAYT